VLASGSEGIKESIASFDDARGADIENERVSMRRRCKRACGARADVPHSQLPPDLIDADEFDPASPADGRISSPVVGSDDLTGSPSVPSSPGGMPSSPSMSSGHRRGHSRTSSLGTTATSSPSNRRRSLESTVNMIKEALSGEEGADEAVSAA